MEHLLPDTPGCRVSWAMMAELARWRTPSFRTTWVGICCLVSAVNLSHGLCQLMCARRGMCFACKVLAIICFSKPFGLATQKKLNTEMCIRRTKFAIAALIFEPLGRYLCWWMIQPPRGSHQLSNQCSIADAGTSDVDVSN